MAIAVIFPGQGSQFAGMADAWTRHPAGSDVLQRASRSWSRDVVEACRDEAALATTEVAQPAVFACDVAAFAVLEAEGASFGATAGHSLGEFAALVAAGVLELEPAMRLVVERGRAMQAAADEHPGTMTALLGPSPEEAAEICEAARGEGVLVVANENAAAQTVLAGSLDAIERAEQVARERRARAIRLNVAGAFHSPLMEPAAERIRAALNDVTYAEPRIPVVANVTGELVTDPSLLKELSARHVLSPVRWQRSVLAMAGAGFDSFAEAGPGDVLAKLVRRIAPGVTAVSIADPGRAAAFAAGKAP